MDWSSRFTQTRKNWLIKSFNLFSVADWVKSCGCYDESNSMIIELNFYFCITHRECHNFFILYSHLNYSSQMLRVKMRVTVRAISLLSLSLAQSFWRLCNLSSYFPSVSFLFHFFYVESFHQKHQLHLRENSGGMCCLSSSPPLQMLLTSPSKPSTFTPDPW